MTDFKSLAVFIKAEERHCGFGVYLVVVNGAVVDVRIVGVEKLDHLGAGPYCGAVAVSGFHTYRTVGIVSGFEAHAGSYAYILNLALGIDFR